MRIAHIIGDVVHTGGVRIVLEHVNRLSERGHSVDLYARSSVSPDWFDLHGPVLGYTTGLLRLGDFSGYDLIVANFFEGAMEALGIRHPIKVHFYQGYAPLLFPEQHRASARKVFDLYDRYLTVSQALRSIVLRAHGHDSVVVPMGLIITISRVTDRPTDDVIRKNPRLPS